MKSSWLPVLFADPGSEAFTDQRKTRKRYFRSYVWSAAAPGRWHITRAQLLRHGMSGGKHERQNR